jgi:hypothetical protein
MRNNHTNKQESSIPLQKTQISTEPYSTETGKSQGEDNHKKEEATSMGRLHLDTNNEHPNVGDMKNNPQDTRQKKILQNNSSQPAQRNGTLTTDEIQMANTLGEQYQKASSDNHYSKDFLKHKQKSENLPLQYNSNDNRNPINHAFTPTEMQAAMNRPKASSAGPDNQTY